MTWMKRTNVHYITVLPQRQCSLDGYYDYTTTRVCSWIDSRNIQFWNIVLVCFWLQMLWMLTIFCCFTKTKVQIFWPFVQAKSEKIKWFFPRGEISCQSKLDSGQMNVLKCINSISSWLSTSGRVNWSPGTWFFCNDVRMMDIMMCTSSLIMLKVLEFRSTHPKTYSARPILILWNIQSGNSLQARHYRIKPTVSQTRNLIVQWPKAN